MQYNERSGSSGRGVVIQDVNASTSICMSMIRDLPNYKKMVPHVKAVEIYESNKFMNVRELQADLTFNTSLHCS